MVVLVFCTPHELLFVATGSCILSHSGRCVFVAHLRLQDESTSLRAASTQLNIHLWLLVLHLSIVRQHEDDILVTSSILIFINEIDAINSLPYLSLTYACKSNTKSKYSRDGIA